MITFITDWPGIEEIKRKIDEAKYFNFSKFPIPKINHEDVIKVTGIIPYVNEVQHVFQWEETIAYWANKMNKYYLYPYKINKYPTLEHFSNIFLGKDTDLLEDEFEQWNPIYEYIKEKFHGKSTV